MGIHKVAVATGAVMVLVAMTVRAAPVVLYKAHVSGQASFEVAGHVLTKPFSDKDLISTVTTSKTAMLVINQSTDALAVIDKCGNLISNLTTEVSTSLVLGPDLNTNLVASVVLSILEPDGSTPTNGNGVVAISNGKTFKKTVAFQFHTKVNIQSSPIDVILVGKVITSSKFKPPTRGCP